MYYSPCLDNFFLNFKTITLLFFFKKHYLIQTVQLIYILFKKHYLIINRVTKFKRYAINL